MIAPFLARSALLLSVFAAACGDDSADDATTGASSTTTGGGASGGVGGAAGGAGANGGAGTGGFGGIPIDDGDWTCLGDVEYPLPTSPSVTLNLKAVVITNGGPIADVTVSACADGDAPCAAPITSGTTDAAGEVSLTVPTGTVGFDGSFLGTGATIPDSYVFPYPPVASDVDSLTLRLIDNGALSLLSTLFAIDSDPTRGHLGVAIQDCALDAAAAMTVSVDAADGATKTLYIKGDLPDASAQTTDESGVVSLFNVPPGTATVTATRVSTGEVIGSVVVTIVAGAVTYATLPPT